jgi:hypothetical protein
MATDVEVQLEQRSLGAVAEGPPVVATAEVRNRGAVVDEYVLAVEGLDPAWWDVTPATVSLFPGQQASVSVQFHPPAGAVADLYSARLRADSVDSPGRSGVAEFTLQVAPTGGLALSLDPAATSGRLCRISV